MHSDGLLLSRVIDGPVSCRGSIAKALATLLHAADFAQFSGRSLWGFAVELSELHRLSLDSAAIRWLVLEGLVEMAIEEQVDLSHSEIVQPIPGHRTFRPIHTMAETEGLCFVLTDVGIRLARELTSVLPEYSCDAFSPGTSGEKPNLEAAQKPTWIAAVRELRVGQTLLKRFRAKAPAQEIVLAAFEEDGWPRRIDDPLVSKQLTESKHRLRATIQSLNRYHEKPMIRFRADGS